MYLHRIELERFGALDQQEYLFRPGLNLVKGPNEAGKSTLQTAILCALFGNPSHKTIQRVKHVDDLVSWQATNPFCITLDVVAGDGKTYRLKKDWTRGESRMTEKDSGRLVQGVDEVQRELYAMLGCTSIKVFRSTACVEQDAINDLSDGRKTIGDRLQRLVTSGGDEAAASDVLQKLEDKISEMERGWKTHAPKNPGPISRKRSQLADIEEALSRARKCVSQVSALEEEIQAKEDRLRKIRPKLKTLRALRKRCDDRSDWEENLETWRDKEAELERTITQIQGARARIDEIDENLAQDYSSFDALDQATVQEMREKHQRVRLLREGIESAKRQLDRFRSGQEETRRRRRAVPIAPLACLGVSALLILVGLVVGLAQSSVAGILIGVVGVLLGGGGLIWLVVALNRSASSPSETRIEDLEQELSQKRDRLERLTNELTQTLNSLGCRTWEEFSDRCSQFRRLLNERERAKTRYDTLVGDQGLETLTSRREEASRKRRDAEEVLSEPAIRQAGRVSPQQYEAIVQEIDRLEKETGKIRERLVEARALSRDPAYTVEDVHRLQEDRTTVARSLDRLQDRLGVYRLTKEVLQEAKDRAMRSARDELEPRLAAHLARITRGRYDKVRADEELNLHIFSPRKDGWVAADGPGLSSGTLDQLYLAARLALIELLYQDARPPLLLDDPFVKFDAVRRERAVVLCREIARDHQVVLFTCHDHYDATADWILELGRAR